jgi:hypothetical protein
MRILVLTEENGIGHVRESREVFEVEALKLSYTCPVCQTEFIFSGERPEGKSDPIYSLCPVCSTPLRNAKSEKLVDPYSNEIQV